MRLLLCLMWITTEMLAQSTASPQVSHFMIDSPQSGLRKIWLYLPEDYARSGKRYPVLYMHDAQNLFDAHTSFAGEWRVDETLDSLKAQVIVVGIEHGSDKRIDEMTPFKNEKYGGGNADAYVDFIVSTLKPAIDKTYRTKKSAQHTIIMGSSLGGLVSLYAALKHPDVFGNAGIFSPSLWFSGKIFTVAATSRHPKVRFYFLAGDQEDPAMLPDMQRMEALLRAKPGRLQEKIVRGGKHNEQLWRENFANAYLWLIDRK